MVNLGPPPKAFDPLPPPPTPASLCEEGTLSQQLWVGHRAGDQGGREPLNHRDLAPRGCRPPAVTLKPQPWGLQAAPPPRKCPALQASKSYSRAEALKPKVGLPHLLAFKL